MMDKGGVNMKYESLAIQAAINCLMKLGISRERAKEILIKAVLEMIER